MFWMKFEKPGQESEIERISDSRPAPASPAARGEDSSPSGFREREKKTMERQETNDMKPARWVPVLDAVEAVIDRIVRESAERQERRHAIADAGRA